MSKLMSSVRLAPLVGLALYGVTAVPASAHVPQCTEYVNPHGQNIPPAGSTTLPGPNGGQNEDGFYLIGSDVGTPVTVVDAGTGTSFGPFPSGTVVKYTQAPGATPSEQPMGSNNGQSDNGQAGAVFVHITGQGDMNVVSIDGAVTSCLVPPPPK
jgi:hypothetical protein